MGISLHAQWKTSRFLQNENKSGYTISLWTGTQYPLSKEDTKTLIDILSTYSWEEEVWEKNNQNTHYIRTIEENQTGWWAYHFYIYNYYITITHPDKRKVTLRINSGGIGKDDFLIEYSNGKPFGTFRLNGRLSDNDIKEIKQLFLKNSVNFNSVGFHESETVKIKNLFSFSHVFYNLEVSISMDAAWSKQFIDLYNSGWNNSAESGGGHPIFIDNLYTDKREIWYGRIQLDLSKLDFRDEVRQKLEDMINNITFAGHNGEEEKVIGNTNPTTYYYQYKNGLLHGQVKVYFPEGTLIREFVYDNGVPLCFIAYTAKGIKEKEFHFTPKEMSLTWIEYDEKGNVKDSGKSQYHIYDYGFDDLFNLYKTSK